MNKYPQKTFNEGKIKCICGDCLAVMRNMEEELRQGDIFD